MSDSGYYNETILAAARALQAQGDTENAFATLAEPLHEALYRRQDFNLLDELPVAQRLLLAFDYVRTQVQQGGFIQLIQNGYISLLVTVIESLQELAIVPELIPVLDDTLKVFVLNKDTLARETSVEEFSRLYAEFREFEELDRRFMELLPAVQEAIIGKIL